MAYTFSKMVKDNDTLRQSFNALTSKTFYFDFEDWYAKKHWGDLYVPHVLIDDDTVISNVSVNFMTFDINGTKKNYIQLGTVMTDQNYAGQGLNRQIMEYILETYGKQADGIYLFANDSVTGYYPKYGFKPSKEYEYYMPWDASLNINPYQIHKVNMNDTVQQNHFYKAITAHIEHPELINPNDGFYMKENLGLYQFWTDEAYADAIYYLPEIDVYAAAECNESTLQIHQIFGTESMDICRFAKSFNNAVKEIVLGYTPADASHFYVREYKEEDCTLFILGEDLTRIEKDKLKFPVLSHA